MGKPAEKPAEETAAEQRRREFRIIKFERIREDDAEENPFELEIADQVAEDEADAEVERYVRLFLEWSDEIDVAAARVKRSSDVLRAWNARRDALLANETVRRRLFEYIDRNRSGKTKYADGDLSRFARPEVTFRVSSKARPAVVTVQDEDALKDAYTRGVVAEPGEVVGPFEWVPGHWKLNKAELNKVAKSAVDAKLSPPAGVTVEEQSDGVYITDRSK